MSPTQFAHFLAHSSKDLRDAFDARPTYVERGVPMIPGHCMQPPRPLDGMDVYDSWLMYRTTDLCLLAPPHR